MNAAPYLHLAWKEYRAVRAIWLAIVLLVIFLMGLSAMFSTSAGDTTVLVCAFALGAPAFFAAGAAGASFAVEREEGTFDFLRASPVAARWLVASKLSVVVAATAGMFAVLWLAALAFSRGQVPQSGSLRTMLGLWPLAAVEAIAWGTLFSLLLARPLVAVLLAIATASTVLHLLAVSLSGVSGGSLEQDYVSVIPWRLVVVAIVLAVDIRLGLRWLDGGETAKRRKIKRTAAPAAQRSGDIKTLASRPERGAILGHLLWQHLRQSGRLMGLLAGVQIGLVVLAIYSGMESGGPEVLPLLPLVALAAVMGSAVFLADQERRQFRFFVEHNVPPRYVWVTRQLPWMATCAVSSLAAIVLWLWLANFPQSPHIEEDRGAFWLAVWSIVACIALSYAAGQWTSMMVRSGLLAGFFGLLLAAVLCGWAGLMLALSVGWWWSVWPIPLVLLWATWLRAPDWVRENTAWAARGKAACAVLLPAAALGLLLPLVRVYGIPLVTPGFDEAAYLAALDAEARAGRATAALYRRADELFESRWGFKLTYPRYPVGGKSAGLARTGRVPNERELAWLEANREPLDLLLEASRRKNCLLDDPRTASDVRPLRNAAELVWLLIASARQLEAEGKLDEALDRYFAALRVISHWTEDSASRWIEAYSLSPADEAAAVLAELPHWAAQQGQTVERIRGAIARVKALDSQMLHLDDGLQAAYLVARRMVALDDTAARALLGDRADEHAMRPDQWRLRLLPWEKYRDMRLLNRRIVDELDRMRLIRNHLHTGEGAVYDLPTDPTRYVSVFSAVTRLQTATSILLRFGDLAAMDLVEFENWRRATLILLAIEAYRLEHGQLPETLEQLVPAFLDALPRDPYSGLDFVYFPQGLPQPTTEIEKAQLDERRWGPTAVPGVPCIWSTSIRLLVQFWRPSALDDASPPAEIPYYVRRDHSKLSTFTAWRLGHWFPIPARQE